MVRLRQKRYEHSAKGKATKRRYKISAKGRAGQQRYNKSPKGHAADARYYFDHRCERRFAIAICTDKQRGRACNDPRSTPFIYAGKTATG